MVMHLKVGCQPPYKVQRSRRRSLKEERWLETNSVYPFICRLIVRVEVSRVPPLWPLGHQAARCGAHLSPSLRAPAHPQTHLNSNTSLITFPISVTPLGSFLKCYWLCFHVGALFVLRVYCFIYLLKHSLPELASWLSAHLLQNNTSPKGSIRECFFMLFFVSE
jgi:hypothetical protein